MINTYITELVNYGIRNGLIDEMDKVYSINRLAELMGLDEYIVPDMKPDEKRKGQRSEKKQPNACLRMA